MNSLRQALEEYIAVRRGLGTAMRDAARELHQFVDVLEGEDAEFVTTEIALRWACASTRASPATWARRLGDVRRFAAWRSAVDPRTEIPSQGLLPFRFRRRPPYVYSDEEIGRIVEEAARLPSPTGLRARTCSTLFALLSATGMRLGETLALDRDDVDLAGGILLVRRAKFGKSRFIPVHDSTRDALREFARDRDRLLRRPRTPAFLVGEQGARFSQWSARRDFVIVSRAVGLRPATDGERHGHGPRLHDMRHRFAAARLLEWYRAGRDVERELPKLATYLGHVHVADTYWYLEAVPEILQLATDRLVRARRTAP